MMNTDEELRSVQLRLVQLSAIVESSRDAIIGMDLGGIITCWNRGAERLFGYSSDEVIGKHLTMWGLPAGEDSAKTREVWRQALEQVGHGHKPDYEFESPCRRKDGQRIDTWLTFSPILAGNKVCGVSVIARDITERKQSDRDAREALLRRDHFLAMLSHELRNPLSAVLNAIRVLEGEDIEEQVRKEARGAIERQSRQMARLLDDLLDVSRITRNKIEIRRQILDLRIPSREALEVIQPLAASRRLRLHIDLPATPLWVEGDADRLQQIQLNLLTNSVKFTPPGGEIHYTAGAEDGHAVLSFRDTGVGIPAEMRERIFELFVQLDQDSEKGKGAGGMGIGLTLARTLVQLHRGTVSVQQGHNGRGSQFTVRIPLAASQSPDADVSDSRQSLSGLKVLLAEDQPDLRTTTVRLLQVFGCEVVGVADGNHAIAEAQRRPFDLGLIDIGMPGLTGYEVVRQMRQLPKTSKMFLVALTGFGQPEDRAKALDSGFDGHLVKPVDLNQLAALALEARHRNPESGRF